MAATIKEWAKAAEGRLTDAERKALRQRMTSGTTTPPGGLTVVAIGEEKNLALVSWDFGHKEIVPLAHPRRDMTDAERAALRRLLPAHLALPNRLTGSALTETIVALSKADEVWTAVVAEEEAKLRAENERKAATDMELRRIARRNARVLAGWPAIEQAIRVVLSPVGSREHHGILDAYETLREALDRINKEA